MKKIKALFGSLLLLGSLLCFSVPALASNSYSTISSVKITVDESLRKLKSDDSKPTVDVSNFTAGNEDKYVIVSADWYDNSVSDSLQVGSTPQVVLYLEAQSKEKSNGDEIEYRFSGSYTASNVSISGGTFVSCKRNDYYSLQVVLALKGVEGDYDTPTSPAWASSQLGLATWTAPSNTSGYYKVTLMRDTKKIVTITTDGTSLNFYPWMTEVGQYSFEVRTLAYTAEQKRYGKDSDDIESETLSITAENRSNGQGKYDTTQINGTGSTGSQSSSAVDNSNTVGWYQSGGKWYFRYPNGQPAVSSWLQWKDRWYHFNAQGQMETGWYKNAYGYYFYLEPTNGYMKTGWQQINNVWYYLNPNKDSNEGAMYANCISSINGESYCFASDGSMKTGWQSMKDSSGTLQYYYFYDSGKMAKNTSISGFTLDATGKWVH